MLKIRIMEPDFQINQKESGEIEIWANNRLALYILLAVNSPDKENKLDNMLLLQKLTAIGYLFSHKKEGEQNKIIVFHDGPNASCGGTGKTSVANVINGFVEIGKYLHPSIHEREEETIEKPNAKVIIIDGFASDPLILKDLCNIDQKVLIITNHRNVEKLPSEFVTVEFGFPYKGTHESYAKLKETCKRMLEEAETITRDYQNFIDGCVRTYEEFGLIKVSNA